MAANLYETLGVKRDASADHIRKAYRKLARKHHPDVNQGDKGGADAKIKDINEAYEVLGDPEKRKKYDELGANWRQYEQAGAGAPGAATGPYQGAPSGGFRTMTEEEMREMFGDADPFSDFFHTFFGGAGGPMGGDEGGRSRRPSQGHYELARRAERQLERGGISLREAGLHREADTGGPGDIFERAPRHGRSGVTGGKSPRPGNGGGRA